jgi:hypothetical protein
VRNAAHPLFFCLLPSQQPRRFENRESSVGGAPSKFTYAEMSSAINKEMAMKRNENGFSVVKSLVVVKLLGLLAVAALSGCASMGANHAGDIETDVTEFHRGA